MKKFVLKTYKDVVAVVLMLALMSVIVYVLMDMKNFDLAYPMSYDGGDGMSYLANAVMLTEGSNVVETDRLGAPYGYTGYDFYASSFHGFDNMLLKILVGITNQPALAVNLLFLLLFPMISLSSYFVLRQMRVKQWVAVGGALTYAFMPYLFMRGMNHFVLASYYFVPVSILYCVWIYQDDNFMCFNKGFFKNWKNWFAIILSACIANNGIAYYAFFTCFFLVVTGLVKALKEKKLRYFGKACSLIGFVVLFMLISLIPTLNYILKNGVNDEGVVRTIDGVETYSLKIAQLFMPLNSHGNSYLEGIINEYNEAMPLVNENYMSYLGVMGCIGFLILLVVLFIKNMGDDKPFKVQLEILSLLNIAGILLATIGGFGSLFGLLVTAMIRCYNRISIFIAFIAIAAVCILLSVLCDRIWSIEKYGAVVRNCIYGGFAAVISFVMLWGIWFQYPGLMYDYMGFKEYFISDKEFIESIEARLPEGAMIYQLPYHEYPEGGSVNDMNDYDLWVGYIHSKNLRWSYGGVVGREADNWLRTIDNSDIPDMIKKIKEKGFQGIYIDRRAYEDDELYELESKLEKELGVQPMISGNKKLSFFHINNM